MFKTKPDRKTPDYYKIILNPISLGMIRTNLRKGRYPHPRDFLRDLAQLVWNAKTYNAKDSLVYTYAVMIENFIKNTIIPTMRTDPVLGRYGHNYEYPYLGPLPEELLGSGFGRGSQSVPQSPSVSGLPVSYSNTPVIPSLQTVSAYTKKHGDLTPQPPKGIRTELSYEAWCKRGRPPIIDRPYEQRIKNVMKGIKKAKNLQGELLHLLFDRVPDIRELPKYHKLISNPICLETIKLKIRQRNYSSVDQFADDLMLMLNNAKKFNPEGLKIASDAIQLQQRVEALLEEEKKKPDMAYLVSDGYHSMRIPLDEIEVDGKKYKVGDWLLIRNPNDENKPIVAQLFRMWKTQDDKRWINVCWYYRPEQTVHRYDRLFYPNEVCKSGQYRDHQAEEIVGKCYVAYFTRYQRGDPGVPYEGPLFVCEFRYNDTDKGFNKIRTWKACLPDEVRHIEDPIIPLKSPRVMPKIESPLKHLLAENATDHDPIPDPTLGYVNAPPFIGAVYKRPPDPKDDSGQYLTTLNPLKNGIPKTVPNMRTSTGSMLSQTPPSPQSHGVSVHYAMANYGTYSTNYAYTLPEDLELRLQTSAIYKADKGCIERRNAAAAALGSTDAASSEPQTIWYCAPPLKVSSKIHVDLATPLGGRPVKSEGHERVVDGPGWGYGLATINHSGDYIRWKRAKKNP